MTAGVWNFECRRLTPDLQEPLARFFESIAASQDARYFHPHPLTRDEATRLAVYVGNDLYYVIIEQADILAYGMLRGWDAGFAVPSLGLAVHPSYRKLGVGRLLVEFLHVAARRRGAHSVRLKVFPANVAAVHLYQRLGYVFQGQEGDQIVGTFDLARSAGASSQREIA